MRIAFTGTHRVGKTSLIEALGAQLPAYQVLEEPYRVLEDDGYEFADPPSIEDYEQQLHQSIDSIASAGPNALIDRCPLDFVAYLLSLDEGLDVDGYLDEIRVAMALLDLIVVVPIETPDRIDVAAHEDKELRRRVGERLQALALDDPYGFGTATLEVSGRLDERVRQVMDSIAAGGAGGGTTRGKAPRV